MGRTATIIAVAYTVVSALAIVYMAIVALSTRARRRAVDHEKLSEREKTWFGIVVVLLVALLFATIFLTPYGRGERGHSQVVDVRAQQFAWTGLRDVRTGEEVEFVLTSRDVSHAFAVYNPDDQFLFQVNVMPGKTQIYRYTFHRAGTYRVLCFEYCGVNHQQMIGQFRVTGA